MGSVHAGQRPRAINSSTQLNAETENAATPPALISGGKMVGRSAGNL